MKRLATVIGVAGTILILAHAPSALALTRADALVTAQGYLLQYFDVTEANQYPAVSCYDPDNPDYLPKLGVGSYVGLVYSFRLGEPFTPIQIVTHLYDDGRGAGNSKDFQATHQTCVANSITGLDCSQFVSAAWQTVPRVNTSTLRDIATELDDAEDVRRADAFDKVGSHVILFADSVADDGTYTSYEANGNEGKCAIFLDINFNQKYAAGYRPYVANTLKDAPAATLVSFGVRKAALGTEVKWVTLCEERTSGFIVCRAASREQPFVELSPLIPATGESTTGARYTFVDATPPPGGALYRLKEIETNGREIWHLPASASDEARAAELAKSYGGDQ